MIDVEPLIEESFERMHPVPVVTAEWEDVLRRAGNAPRKPARRRIVLAIALAALAALAVSPLGAAVVRSLGDFSDWISGDPGKPASTSQQQAFAGQEAHSWASFPADTRVRELITTERDGIRYTLFGFRSAEALCLRVVATGAAGAAASSCAPLRDLRSRRQPVLAMEVDQAVGALPGVVRIGPDSFHRVRASMSFGVVADDVEAVTLRSDDKSRNAIVASDSFLSIDERPMPGTRVRAITATMKNGTSTAIPFAQAPFDTLTGTRSASNALHGPTGVERRISGGTIAWLNARKPLGEAWPPSPRDFFAQHGHLLFGRVFRPDPTNTTRIGVSTWDAEPPAPLKPGVYLCYREFSAGGAGGGGCNPLAQAFARSPVNFGITTNDGSDQYSLLDGYASDDVARIDLFLGTGEVVNVPLEHNVFATEFSRAKYPLRVVGYDSHGRVISNDTMMSENRPSGPQYRPKPGAAWRQVARAGNAELWTVPSEADGTCWKLKYSDGSGGSGCLPPSWNGPLRGIEVPFTAGSVIALQAKPAVARVVVAYKSGATDEAIPTDGFVLYAAAASDLVTSFTAYDSNRARLGVLPVKRP